MSSIQIPVVFHLLADRALRPGALLWEFPAVVQKDCESLLTLVETSQFSEVGTVFPCFVSDRQVELLPELVLLALKKAGCQLLDEALVSRSDDVLKPTMSAQAMWLDGVWMLAPPAKSTGGQLASRGLALKLVQLVVADADTRDIEDVFRQDPTLSYHLLRLVNSPGMGAPRRITSFAQAILILGRQQLRRWVNLMLFSARSDDYRGPMLLARVTLRARFLELLARETGLSKADQDLAFMAGMFSLLGVLFGLPLSEVFKPLQISEVIVAAVQQHAGEIGQLLRLVETTERCDSSAVDDMLCDLDLRTEKFNLIYLEACQWMLNIVCEAAPGTGHE